MSVRDLPDDWAGVKCFAGCSTDDILQSLGLPRSALKRTKLSNPTEHRDFLALKITFPPLELPSRGGPGSDPAWRFEAAHVFGEQWRLTRSRHPSGRKDLRWDTRDAAGAWIPGLRGVPEGGLPLYLERDVLMAIAAGEPVHLVESESSVDALAASGRYATTWAGGASSPPLAQLAHTLNGANLVLIPDNDPPGRACAARITAVLEPITSPFSVLYPAEGQDARDLLNQGGVPR